jgi:hypothetical protein
VHRDGTGLDQHEATAAAMASPVRRSVQFLDRLG